MWRLLLLVLLGLLLGACSDNDPAGPDTEPAVGLYVLQSINGQPMPYPLINIGSALALHQMGGTMRLNADNTSVQRDSLRWTIVDEQGVPQISDTTVVFSGHWERTDSVMEVVDEFDQLQIGLLSGRTLTLNLVLDTVYTYVYLKQNP